MSKTLFRYRSNKQFEPFFGVEFDQKICYSGHISNMQKWNVLGFSVAKNQLNN